MASFLIEAEYKGDPRHPVFHPGAKYDVRVRITWLMGRVQVVRVTGYDNSGDLSSLVTYADFKQFLEQWTIIKGLGEYERRLGPNTDFQTDTEQQNASQQSND